MQTEIKVKGFLTRIQTRNTQQGKKFVTFSIATNIYNFNDRDENNAPKVQGTIWTNFIYWGELDNIEVGMPVLVEGHLALSQDEKRAFNLVADSVHLNLSIKKSNQYIKGGKSQ
jgi:primosomal replication protein N